MTSHSLKPLFVICLFIWAIQLSAQYYSSGTDPASIKWQQINTDRFRMVFPTEFQASAINLAAFLDSMAPKIEGTMLHHPRKIDILIHGRSTNSNGFVSWAPKRIELFPNPHQEMYSQDWLQQLIIHEYRHVVQIDKLNQGFTRLLNWIWGQQATGAVQGGYLPLWLLEGDAVTTETALSRSGRGRWPLFSQSLRARLTTWGPDSYDKAYLGSYTDFVPDYYRMGYQLTARLRQQYGSDLWADVFNNTGRNSWSLTPVRHALKKKTRKGPKQLYDQVFTQLAKEWQDSDKAVKPSPYEARTHAIDDYTNYQYPVVLPNHHIIAQVSGPGQRQRIVELFPDKKEVVLAYTGSRNEDPISANEQWVVWSEIKPTLRWENADYSIIRTWNRQTRQVSSLTHRSRYFSPQVKPGSDTIVVVESTADYHFFITTISLSTGSVLKRIPTPSNAYPLHPSWSDRPNEVVCLLLDETGKRIVSLQTNDETWQTLRPAAFDEPRFPVKRGSRLWFSASTPNAEELFRLDLSTGICHQVTRARFGATTPYPYPDGTSIAYANYTPQGYQLATISSTQTIHQKPVSPASLTTPLIETISQQEVTQSPATQSTIDSQRYTPKPYSRFNIFNLHSWAPHNVDIENETVNSGVTLMSQNLLGTAFTTVGYNASSSHSHEKYQVGFTWAGWFPIFDLDLKWGNKHQSFNGIYANRTDTFRLAQVGNDQRQMKLETGIRVPLRLNNGPWYRLLQPRVRLTWQNITYPQYQQTFYTSDLLGQLVESGRSLTTRLADDIHYWSMEYSLYFANQRKGTTRDVGTRWGQSAEVIYQHTPWGNYEAGRAFAVSSVLNLPGIGQHHSLSLTNSWQTIINGDEYQSDSPFRTFQKLNDLLSYPRGYSSLLNDEMYLFRGTYKMPLWNPDASLANLVYLKRFRLNLFFDAARTQFKISYSTPPFENIYRNTYTSSGIELMADFHLFRFVLPFSAGYRGGFRSADNHFFHEAILTTSFGNFLVN